MYYLLGWMVGDLGKNFTKNQSLARLELDLSRKYPENLPLGSFVMTCISMIGIPCGRIADGPPRKRDRHGLYRWVSYFSEVVAWLHTACLGLQGSELTSYDPVKMKWMLTASREARIWFLRGVADSDGTVSMRNRTVVITSEPNTAFFKTLFKSLGLRAWTHTSRGFGCVTISATDAAKMRIFNPEIETHRGRLLKKLATARTFQRRWPNWLENKAASLQMSGLSPSAVRNRILFEDNTYVKLKTIKSKQVHVQEWSRRWASIPRPHAYEACALPG